MKKRNKYFSFVLVFILTIGVFCTSFTSIAYAGNLGDISYTEYREFDELINKIITISNNQRIMQSKICAKWDNYSANDQEKYEDISKYISYTESNIKIFSGYNSGIANRLKDNSSKYMSDLKVYTGKNYKEFYSNGVVYFDYVMLTSEFKDWYSAYQNYKNGELNTFLKTYVYNNENRVAVKSLSDKNSNNREQGKETLKNTINTLTKIKNDSNTSNIVKGYCSELINHYSNLIAGKKTDISKFAQADKNRLEGLIPIGNVFDEIKEYNPYVLKFNNFSDFPTTELALKLSSKDTNRLIKMLQTVNATTDATIKLKKEHYELIYAITNCKNKKQPNIDKEYQNFFNDYRYLDQYYNSIMKQYGADITSQMVVDEITDYKDKLSCIDKSIPSEYSSIQYKKVSVKDTNEYRQLANSDSNKFLKILPCGIGIIVLGGVVFVIIRVVTNKKSNDYYSDDDYYNNNNYY